MWSLNVVLIFACGLANKFVSNAVLNPRAEKDGLKFEWSFSVLLNLSATKHVVLNLSALFLRS